MYDASTIGKRERLTFARKGTFLPGGPCLNQYNGWSTEKRGIHSAIYGIKSFIADR